MIGKNILTQLFISGWISLLSLVILSISARTFGVEVFGQIAYYLALLGVVFAFSDLGLSRAHIHFTAYQDKPKKTLGTFLTLKSVLFFFCLITASIYGYFSQELSIIFWVLISSELFSRFADSILITYEGLQQSLPQNLIRFIAKVIKLIGLLIIIMITRNSLGYSLTYLIESFTTLIIAGVIIKKFSPLLFSKPLASDYIRYSLPFMVIIPLSYFQSSSIPIILRHFSNLTQVGYFAAAFSIFSFLKTLSGSLMIYFFPKISSLYKDKQFAAIQQYTDLAVKFSVIIFLPIISLLYLFRHLIIRLVLGVDFLGAVGTFSWLLIGFFILLISAPYDHVLFATRNHRIMALTTSVSLIILIGLSLILVPQYGSSGSAMALTISWLIGGWWQYLILKSKTQIRFCKDFSFGRKEVKYLKLLFSSFIKSNSIPGKNKVV